MGDIAQRGNRLTFAKGGKVNTRRENRLEELGRVDAEKAYSRKGKRNLREEKHRIRSELKKGGKPWGTGPKPGTHEFLEHHLHKPRKGKAAGSIIKKVVQGGKKIIDKIKKKKRHESLDIPGSPGPHIGKYPGIDKAMKNIKKSGDIWGPGKAAGGRIGRAAGGPAVKRAAEKAFEHFGGGEKGKPHSSKEGRIAAGKQNIKRAMARRKQWKTPDWKKKPDRKFKKYSDLLQRYPKMPQPHKAPGDTPHIPLPKHDPKKPKKYQPAATGGRIGFKKGGSDKNWIQKAVNPKHKGYCTPMTKKTCTPARKALARTFKKKAKTGW